jgi:hypothetical protein
VPDIRGKDDRVVVRVAADGGDEERVDVVSGI